MKENVLVFSGYSNVFSWNLRIFFRRLGKKLGTFLNAAKYLYRRTICHLFLEKMLFISLLWARNLSDSKKNLSEKVLSFSFFVCRGHLGAFYQRFKLFWTWAWMFELQKNIFQQCFQKCIQGVEACSWNLHFFCQRLGRKVAVVLSKQLKTCAEEQFGFSSQRKSFFVSLLWAENFQTLGKTSPKSTQFFIFCEQKKNLEVSFKWKVPLVKYFERKTSRLWSKLLRKNLKFSFFGCRWHFDYFPGDLGCFVDCKLKYLGSSRKVFNSVFESAFKMGKTAYLFFLDSSKFSLELELFFQSLSEKNSGCFLKTAEYVRRRTMWYFFQRKCFFISLFWAGNFQTLTKTSPKKYCFSFFVCRGSFFQRSSVFLGLWV